jgi:hypothetical protein
MGADTAWSGLGADTHEAFIAALRMGEEWDWSCPPLCKVRRRGFAAPPMLYFSF